MGKEENVGGRPPFDVVLMMKILVLQSLYNLADDATEHLIRDRLSFMRFLGLSLGDRVPDAKTIWLFREQIGKAGMEREMFDWFDGYLRTNGFVAKKGKSLMIQSFQCRSNATAGKKMRR